MTEPAPPPIEGVVWPPVATGPGATLAATLAALVSQLDASQWFTADELDRRALQQLSLLATHCERHSAYFAERMKAAGVAAAELASPGGLRCLPPMSRRHIQEAGERLFCGNVPKAHMPLGEVRTSGSTGEPVHIRRTSISNLMWMANTLRDHLWHRRDFSAPMAAIRANITSIARSADWGPPVNLLFASGPGLGLPVSTPPAQQASLLRELRPGSLLCLPNNLDLLIDEIAAAGDIWPELKHVRTISENVSPRLRRRAKDYFRLEIEDLYSAQEAGVIAVQCPETANYHVMAETVIVEVVDDDLRACGEGEVGRLLVTDLTNFATPVIRYQIADYAEVGGVCACGRGLPVLRRIVGRERNLILMPDGTKRWPLTGYFHFRDIAPVLQFQFVQTNRQVIEVNLVTARVLLAEEEEALKKVIHQALGHPFTLLFKYHDGALPRSASGKFEEFVCRI